MKCRRKLTGKHEVRVATPTGVPRGGLEGSNPPPMNLQKICIVCLQNILCKPCSYVHLIPKFYTGKR